MKFPARRSIWIKEWLSVNRLFIECALKGQDPGYAGEVQDRFKRRFLAWFAKKEAYLTTVGSGTNAIFIAIKALGLRQGSVVHVSPITDPGTVSAIIEAGLKVNVVDAESPLSGQTSLESLESRLCDESSAFLLVHHAGWPARSDLFSKLCCERGLHLIEDFSQSVGAMIEGSHVGTFGAISAASTMYRKTLATGGSGGIVFTSSDQIYKRVELYKDRGKPVWKNNFYNDFLANRDGDNVVLAALNHNQDDINMAIGCSSLARLQDVIEIRRSLVFALREMIKSEVCIPSNIECSSPFIVPLSFQTIDAKASAVSRLSANGVPCNIDYRFNVAKWRWVFPFLHGCCDTPNASEYLEKTIFLYINERYKKKNIKFIAELLNHHRG